MTNLVMMIALWCSNPQYNTYQMREVDACRTALFECTAKSPAGTGFIKCFKERKLIP